MNQIRYDWTINYVPERPKPFRIWKYVNINPRGKSKDLPISMQLDTDSLSEHDSLSEALEAIKKSEKSNG